VDGMEAVLPSCPPQVLTSDFGIRGGGEPLGVAHGVLPARAPAIGQLECALDNLALLATNNSAVLQHLTAANLALTTTTTAFTATSKTLVDLAAKAWEVANPTATAGGRHSFNRQTLARELLLDAQPLGE
jgi:hypothetical protein